MSRDPASSCVTGFSLSTVTQRAFAANLHHLFRGVDHRFVWSARLRSSRSAALKNHRGAQRNADLVVQASAYAFSRLPNEFSTGLCLILAALTLTSCGYHIAGKTIMLPATVQTIAIPAFANGTTVYKLTDDLTEAVTREFISRTKYQITSDPAAADATLRGSVNQVFNFPTVYDPVTFRAANVEVHVNLKIQLIDRSGKVLFDRPGMEVRERYEVSVDPKVYFDESDFSMKRLSKDVAKTVVSAILENF
jgi:hypothetical protein